MNKTTGKVAYCFGGIALIRSTAIAVSSSAILLSGLLGCRKVVEVDLAGTWSLASDSRTRLPASLGKAMGTLELADGKIFQATAIPAAVISFDHLDRDLGISGSGTWRLVAEEYGEQHIQLNFQTITEGPKLKVPSGTQLYVARGSRGPTLYYFDGDPDEGKKISFLKVK